MKYLPLFIIALLAVSCSHTDKGNETAAEIEAAMMEGREAAKIFVSKPWHDTIELQNRLLEARSKRIKYDTLGLKRCAEAYDSGFVPTIRTVNPDVADHIK